MNKLAASYVVIFLIFAYFSSVFEGGGAMVAAPITVAVAETDTEITIGDTTGFLGPVAGWSDPRIMVKDDEVTYTGLTATKFTGCSGITENYPAGTMVYTTDIGVMNKAFGFDIVSTGEDVSTLSAINIAWNFFTVAIGYLVTFNFSLLAGDLVYLRYLLMAPAVGFIIYLAIVAASTVFGIIRGAI